MFSLCLAYIMILLAASSLQYDIISFSSFLQLAYSTVLF